MKKNLSAVVISLLCYISVALSGFAQPCLQVQCPTNKAVQCGTTWTFDLPVATTCCASGIVTSAGTVTNVLITSTSIVTNGACPRQDITQTWSLMDGCGNSTNCSQTVTVLGCCQPPCLTVQCPTNKTVQCGSTWAFDQPIVSTCCTNLIQDPVSGVLTNVLVIPVSVVTNGACPQLTVTETWAIMDGCSGSTNCSQTVTVLGCCGSNCLQVQCPTNKTVQCGTTWTFDQPVVSTCCTTNIPGTTINILVVPSGLITNGACPQLTVTENWSIMDGCGDSTNCSQTVTVLGCCGSNCLQVQCPNNKTVQCGTTWTFDQPVVSTCCTTNIAGTKTNILVVPSGFVTNGVCPQVTVTESWVIMDGCGNSTNCSQTVTVLGCCTNGCCGPGLGAQTIQWLQFPLSGTVTSDPSGTNPGGTWIITNLPCYGNVLVTQNSPQNVQWFLNPNLNNVPNAAGNFEDVETGYGPYSWGTASWLNFLAVNGSETYTVNFYFLSGPPSQCNLYLGVIGLAKLTTATVSQPVTFRGEYDLTNATGSNISAYTMLNGVFGTNLIPGVSGTVVGSAYSSNSIGDTANTGWAVLQPNVNLQNTSLPAGSGTDINGNPYPASGSYPYVSLAVNQQAGDGIGFTVGYVCCPSNCLQVQCPNNKTVQCGTAWTFDQPVVSTCCTNGIVTSAGTLTNVLVTSTGIVTNGVCPQVNVTQSWQIIDGCGDSTNCSQTVTVLGCCPSNCLVVQCPNNKAVPCGTTWTFDPPIASSCCASNFGVAGALTNVLITSLGFTTNGVCPQVNITEHWQISDGCGDTTNCSQTVTVLGCCASNCLVVQCSSNKTVQCGTTWAFNPPTATSCCSNLFDPPSGILTNVLITSASTVTNGVCPKIITQTWKIIDGCGDTNFCTQAVTVVDTTPPVIACPANNIVVALNANCLLVIPAISVTATDNCTPLCSLVYSQSPPAGTIVHGTFACVSVTVTDLCGNSSSCIVCVQGVPKTAPVVTCPATMTVTNCIVPCVPVTATDNCCPVNSLIISQSPPCGTQIGPGITSITVTVTDCHGNTTTKVVHLVITPAQSFLSNLTNTGVGPGGVLLADHLVDPYYSLPPTAVPAGMPPDYLGNAVAVSDVCHATGPGCSWQPTIGCFRYVPWSLPPDPAYVPAASKWIAPDYSNNLCCPPGNYTYTLTFNLPAGFNPATATISGRWASDDGATMKLNGVTVPTTPTGIWSWTPFTIPPSAGFVTGINTLKFIVNNYTEWTGMRIEFTNAVANCFTCVPPVLWGISPAQSLQAGGTATFYVVASGTPPFSYQWLHNNVNIPGATNSVLQIPSIGYAAAGQYTAIVVDPCGSITASTSLTVTSPWWWQWGWWNVASVTNPLVGTFGPPLSLIGSDDFTNYGINAGSTEDFGLPASGGRIVNVMDITPSASPIQIPPITAAGADSDDSYTVVMDVYVPDTSLGNPSTLFQSVACCVSNLGSSGQDGVGLTLDVSNYVHLGGSAGGVPFDDASASPMSVDAWNRVALVVDNPPDGGTATLSVIINTTNVIIIHPCVCCLIPYTASTINWSISPPTLFSAQTNASAPNGEIYVSSVQFHDIALPLDMIAGIGSPEDGPPPANQTSVGASPMLSAAMGNGVVNITWTGSPYALQETTDLGSGAWQNSELAFTESIGKSGDITTTAVVPASTGAQCKFYRLLFNP